MYTNSNNSTPSHISSIISSICTLVCIARDLRCEVGGASDNSFNQWAIDALWALHSGEWSQIRVLDISAARQCARLASDYMDGDRVSGVAYRAAMAVQCAAKRDARNAEMNLRFGREEYAEYEAAAE